jgi:uncharacterized protein
MNIPLLRPCCTVLFFLLLAVSGGEGRTQSPPYKVLVVAASVKDHATMIASAHTFLEKLAADQHFTLDFTKDTGAITPDNLSRYQVFVMLQLAPFDLSAAQQDALQQFATEGKGFIGIHAAGLTGPSFLAPHTRYWQWYEDFMGGVVYVPHPAYQSATVVVEDRSHPATRHLPASFRLSDEWYEFNHSPRNNVHVLASVDEATYHPQQPMGDHPVIWTNEQYRRMIYISMGTDASLFADSNYRTLWRDAMRWAASPSNYLPSVATKNGQVYYQERIPYDKSLSRSEAYVRARQWYSQTFTGALKTLSLDDPISGVLGGTATFELATDPGSGPGAVAGPQGFTGAPSTHYQIQCQLEIKVTDSGYVLTISHYRDRALDKGVTPDFSKVEYRWWDYHGGNPWSAADRPLFDGLHAHSLALLHAFREDVFVVTGMPPRFRVLALYENGGHHVAYSARARGWLDSLALDSNFRVDYITGTDSIDDAYLSRYQLIIQLDYAPYAWTPAAMSAFQRYIEEGRGGWVGFHHATLLGTFDGYPMWSWFSNFMGGIQWKDYIARFARAEVHLENHTHPVLVGIPDSFTVQKEEWYTYDKSPRSRVQVLAHVDESSYLPDTAIKMGDHPVIWTNPRVGARNVYIFMGHSPILFDDTVYTRLFRNAIFWTAATRPATPPRFKALAVYSGSVETDHVDFAKDAIRYFSRLGSKDNFAFDTTSDWTDLDAAQMSTYQVVLWLNDFPHDSTQRAAFETYIKGGGAWMGFHVAAYNDAYTHWPWFVQFLGGAVFNNNSWPPVHASLLVDDTTDEVTRGFPRMFTGPVNEWYGWTPNPRSNKDVKVLVTLDPNQYPLGKKDRINEGDIPVVWTNKKYKMLYLNMGHGDQIFEDPIEDRLFDNALLWLGGKK